MAARAVHVHVLRLRLGDPASPARSALRPTRTTSPHSKYGENKLIGDFLQSVTPLTKTDGVAAPTSTNSAITAQARGEPGRPTPSWSTCASADASLRPSDAQHAPGAEHADQSFGDYTYDDTDPALGYTGSWSHVSNQSYTGGDYKNTESFSDVTGDSMSVTFSGTAVQYDRARPPPTTGSPTSISTAPRSPPSTGTRRAANFQQVLYSASGLADTTSHAEDRRHRTEEPVLGRHLRVGRRDQRPHRGTADRLLPDRARSSLAPRSRSRAATRACCSPTTRSTASSSQYSTSELMTHAQTSAAGRARRCSTDRPAPTARPCCATPASRRSRSLSRQRARAHGTPRRGDLRLDYTHAGLAEVQISGGGRPALDAPASQQKDGRRGVLARDASDAGPALVRGAYLVRSASSRRRASWR